MVVLVRQVLTNKLNKTKAQLISLGFFDLTN